MHANIPDLHGEFQKSFGFPWKILEISPGEIITLETQKINLQFRF